MESFRLHELCKDSPILLRIKSNNAETLATLTANLSKFGNESGCRNGLAGTGFAREDAVHQLALFQTVLERRFVSGGRCPAFAGKHLADIDIPLLHRRYCKLRNVAYICKHATFRDTRQVCICCELIGKQNSRITIGFHSTTKTFLTVICAECVEVVNQVVLLFGRQVKNLQRTDHSFGIRPGRLCKDRSCRQIFSGIGCDINIGKECTVTAKGLHKAHILEIKKRKNVLDLLIHPLIALGVTDGRTDTHTGGRTACDSSARSQCLTHSMPDALCCAVALGSSGSCTPALTGSISSAMGIGIGLGCTVAYRMRSSACLGRGISRTLALGSSRCIGVADGLIMSSSVAPIRTLSRRPAFTGSHRGIGSPGFAVAMGYAVRVNLTNTGADRAANGIRTAGCLTKGLRYAFIPTTALRSALIAAPALRCSGSITRRYGMGTAVGYRVGCAVGIGRRTTHRTGCGVINCRTLAPSFRSTCTRGGTTGITGRTVDNEDTAVNTGSRSFSRTVRPTG